MHSPICCVSLRRAGFRLCLPPFPLPLLGLLLLCVTSVLASKTQQIILWICEVWPVCSDLIATWKAVLQMAEWVISCCHLQFIVCLLSAGSRARCFPCKMLTQQPWEVTNRTSRLAGTLSGSRGSICRAERGTDSDEVRFINRRGEMLTRRRAHWEGRGRRDSPHPRVNRLHEIRWCLCVLLCRPVTRSPR